uniref:Olfactory receptor C family, b1 n=1 Tax=Scleropages formosus TaxID=113540 RepID=A0A8C9SVR1_SCLFO
MKTNTSRIWIASDAWSLAQSLASMPGINRVGEIFGFSFITGQNPGFSEFECTPELLQYNDVYLNVTYGERLAVWAIAHSLRNLLQCNGTHCPGEKNFPSWKVPESRCSQSCPPGTFKKVSNISCCYNCTQNQYYMQNCLICPKDMWSLKGSVQCSLRTETFFGWNEPYAIVLLTFVGLGLLLLLIVFVVFMASRHSPVVKVAGGKLCYIMMAALVVSFGSVVLFMGKPSVHICRARQTMYGLGFTLCVSCILVKAFRTFLAFLFNLYKHSVYLIGY